MKSDGKCIYIGIDEECKCEKCSDCEHYKKLFQDLLMEQQEQM